jgi:hypothetical protein
VLAFNNFFVRSPSTSATVIVPAPNDRIVVTMNGILDDALSGLLLLRDSEDSSATPPSNDSSTTPPSNDSNATHTSNDSSATPTSSPPKKKRKCKKRGSTSFARKKGANIAKYICKATLKPRAAKKNANDAIAKSLTNTREDNTAAVKIRQDDMRKLISLFCLQIGAPPPEDWYGKGGTISRV